MRPAGEFRSLLQASYAEAGAQSVRSAAARTQIGYMAARRTVENMVRAGELRPCGREKPEGSLNWENLYEPVPPEEVGDAVAGIEARDLSLDELARITARWVQVDPARG